MEKKKFISKDKGPKIKWKPLYLIIQFSCPKNYLRNHKSLSPFEVKKLKDKGKHKNFRKIQAWKRETLKKKIRKKKIDLVLINNIKEIQEKIIPSDIKYLKTIGFRKSRKNNIQKIKRKWRQYLFKLNIEKIQINSFQLLNNFPILFKIKKNKITLKREMIKKTISYQLQLWKDKKMKRIKSFSI